MSWVLLSLRKSELKMVHSDYVAQDLQISRQQRQDARRYQAEQRSITHDEQSQLLRERTNYKVRRSGIMNQMKAMREQIAKLDNKAPDYQTQYANLEREYSALQLELNQAQEDYADKTNDIKTLSEEDLAMIEEEANDIEAQHEQDKVMIETQMEAVSQELQAVTQAISQQIQNETIKLS